MRPSRFGSSKRRSKGKVSEEWLSLAPRRAVVSPALFLLKMLLKSSVSKAMAGGETAVNFPKAAVVVAVVVSNVSSCVRNDGKVVG